VTEESMGLHTLHEKEKWEKEGDDGKRSLRPEEALLLDL
jgi:hypothetical protein